MNPNDKLSPREAAQLLRSLLFVLRARFDNMATIRIIHDAAIHAGLDVHVDLVQGEIERGKA